MSGRGLLPSLLLDHMSGWLKSFMRTRSSECEASRNYLKKASATVLPGQVVSKSHPPQSSSDVGGFMNSGKLSASSLLAPRQSLSIPVAVSHKGFVRPPLPGFFFLSTTTAALQSCGLSHHSSLIPMSRQTFPSKCLFPRLWLLEYGHFR